MRSPDMRKIPALLLAAALCLTLLAACGSSAQSSEADSAPAETAEETTEETAAEAEPAEQTEAEETAEEEASAEEEPEETASEIATVEVYTVDMYGNQDEIERIQAAINEITEPEIGVHVNYHIFDMSAWVTQVSMDLAAGTTIDLLFIAPIAPVAFSDMYSSGQLMEIGGLLETWAPETLALLGDYVEAYRTDSGLYGIPTYRNFTSNYYLSMRQDILDELGLSEEADSLSSWDDWTALLDTVCPAVSEDNICGMIQSVYNTLITVNTAFTCPDAEDLSFSNIVQYDNLNDSLAIIYTDEEGNVGNRYATEAYVNELKYSRSLCDAGYVYPDASYSTESGDELMKSGVTFSFLLSSEEGIEEQSAAKFGYQLKCKSIAVQPVTSGTLTNFGAVVPVTAEEPEAACRYLNMLYTDSRIVNLFVYGVEGTDYVVENGEARYPDGMDAGNKKYHNTDFIAGNQFLALPWQGEGSDFREVSLAANENAGLSPYVGFTVDTTNLTDLLAGLTSVTGEYTQILACGGYTDDLYQEFLDKLEAAGVDDYLAYYQEQLDAYTGR